MVHRLGSSTAHGKKAASSRRSLAGCSLISHHKPIASLSVTGVSSLCFYRAEKNGRAALHQLSYPLSPFKQLLFSPNASLIFASAMCQMRRTVLSADHYESLCETTLLLDASARHPIALGKPSRSHSWKFFMAPLIVSHPWNAPSRRQLVLVCYYIPMERSRQAAARLEFVALPDGWPVGGGSSA